jgi:hypothetical protein
VSRPPRRRPSKLQRARRIATPCCRRHTAPRLALAVRDYTLTRKHFKNTLERHIQEKCAENKKGKRKKKSSEKKVWEKA